MRVRVRHTTGLRALQDVTGHDLLRDKSTYSRSSSRDFGACEQSQTQP
jgi:hypothetical protein